MSYINAKSVLPDDIIALIQNYIDGDYLYIPKKEVHKKAWGEGTSTRSELARRNENILTAAVAGATTEEIANRFFLSVKSIQRILLIERKKQPSRI